MQTFIVLGFYLRIVEQKKSSSSAKLTRLRIVSIVYDLMRNTNRAAVKGHK